MTHIPGSNVLFGAEASQDLRTNREQGGVMIGCLLSWKVVRALCRLNLSWSACLTSSGPCVHAELFNEELVLSSEKVKVLLEV